MLAAERRARIRTLTEQQGFVSVQTLCMHLGVSDMTIRRDLDLLERAGSIRRTHGGAMSRRVEADAAYTDRARREVAAKQEIGKTAAALVRDGETILLNAGTTITAMARSLVGRRGLTIVTNAYTIVSILAGEPDVTLLLTGGVVRNATGSLVGPVAERTISALRVDRAFLGTTGVDLDIGFFNSDLNEGALQRTMMRAARATYLLADHTKFGKVSFAHVGSLAAVDAIISDARIDVATRTALRARGVRLIVAGE